MSIQNVNNISSRLSLRKPQRDSLEILQRLCDIVTLEKEPDLEQMLEIIRSEFSTVESFDREFPSLCFALATGVGKTRLMGAFIAYLYLDQGIRNFFVVAPNLTIYDKLKADFTPNTPKYVFKGIGELAQRPPVLITGDNYDSGIDVRFLDFDSIHINIFNISKFTAKDKGNYAEGDENRTIPRVRRLSEYIGESYFDYLAAKDDLVVIMDESHRYRAKAGMEAINDLKPILGLELTATPQVERGTKSEPFENVIYAYPLSEAMKDGYVKEPAVATRENFDPKNYSEEGLEQIKLEDGIRLHEATKADLETYARNSDQPIVKPFVLVVAQDIAHAEVLKSQIEADDFFGGAYLGKVTTVHSKKKSDDDEVVNALLEVESRDNPIEVVIHVNMLKEGWDVTNLYTIVPLRAANSKTLVEQSIGRGLRLPYGRRTGVAAVDRLTIVSHDKFQEIVDYARDEKSIILTGVVIGKDVPDKGKKSIVAPTVVDTIIAPPSTPVTPTAPDATPPKPTESPFKTEREVKAAQATITAIQKKFEKLDSSGELTSPEVQEELKVLVAEEMAVGQQALALDGEVDLDAVIEQATKIYQNGTIDVPKIVVVPKGEVRGEYKAFTIDTASINQQPVSDDLLVQHLQNWEQHKIKSGTSVVEEERPEDYIVRGLIDFDDISYDDHAGLLYNLAGQVVAHLRSYLGDEEQVLNVLQAHQKRLVELIHAQMQDHFDETATSYEATVTKGFRALRPNSYTLAADEEIRDFRKPLVDGEKSNIRNMVFGGFSKCLYPMQKFDSDSERRFAVLIEADTTVQKWFKPVRNDFHIDYKRGSNYEPDFVVEAEDCKYLCEPKKADDMDDEIVQAKAKAAATWCTHASAHAADQEGGKPWKYLLIPHDKISEQMTLAGLAASYEVKE